MVLPVTRRHRKGLWRSDVVCGVLALILPVSGGGAAGRANRRGTRGVALDIRPLRCSASPGSRRRHGPPEAAPSHHSTRARWNPDRPLPSSWARTGTPSRFHRTTPASRSAVNAGREASGSAATPDAVITTNTADAVSIPSAAASAARRPAAIPWPTMKSVAGPGTAMRRSVAVTKRRTVSVDGTGGRAGARGGRSRRTAPRLLHRCLRSGAVEVWAQHDQPTGMSDQRVDLLGSRAWAISFLSSVSPPS